MDAWSWRRVRRLNSAPNRTRCRPFGTRGSRYSSIGEMSPCFRLILVWAIRPRHLPLRLFRIRRRIRTLAFRRNFAPGVRLRRRRFVDFD